MGKFKVGDRVKVLHTDYEGYGPLVGSIFKVGSVLPHGVDPEGEHAWAFFLNEEVELVPAWQPKVGDRVRFTDECNTFWFFGPHTEDKKFGVITSANGNEFWVSVGADTGIVELKHIEPVDALRVPTPVTFTIETGRYYKTRDGRKVGPVRARSDSTHPWLSNFENNTGDPTVLIFRADGRNYSRKHLDLVALWEEPTPASYDNAAVAKPKFKVGDRVVTDGGFSFDPTTGSVKSFAVEDGLYQVAVDGEGMTWSYFESELSASTPTTPAIVALIENGTPRPSTAPKVHTSQEAATTEAERLALEHPGQQFGVFVLADSKIADEVITKTAVLRAA